ncbi:hypothetical protein [Caldithrix abyssi]
MVVGIQIEWLSFVPGNELPRYSQTSLRDLIFFQKEFDTSTGNCLLRTNNYLPERQPTMARRFISGRKYTITKNSPGGTFENSPLIHRRGKCTPLTANPVPAGTAETGRNGNAIVPTGHFFIWVVSLFPAVNCRVILKNPYGI